MKWSLETPELRGDEPAAAGLAVRRECRRRGRGGAGVMIFRVPYRCGRMVATASFIGLSTRDRYSRTRQ